MPSTVSENSTAFRNIFSSIKSNLPALLLISVFFLFISKSLYNIPIGIMAFLGAWRCVTHYKKIWEDSVTRTFIILFSCLWIPLFISFIDSVNHARSSQTVFPYLRFLFFGIYILDEIKTPRMLNQINTAVFFIIAFWCIDALIQLLFGIDLFGYPYRAGDITGMFYPGNTIAHVTACLSPLYFEEIRKRMDKLPWSWLLIIPLIAVILVSGRRAAWIMLAVSMIGYLFYLYKISSFNSFPFRKTSGLAVIFITTVILVIYTNSPLQDRLKNTMELFSGDYEKINLATARRLPIWKTALTMFRENWINGAGPRAFRYAYVDYSEPGDFWVTSGGVHPTTHPHQIILEVLSETGTIGAVGVILFIVVFTRQFRDRHLLIKSFPVLLAVLVAVFPVNTHMAFYGSYWASVFWWVLGLVFLTYTYSASPSAGEGPGHKQRGNSS